VHSLENMTLPLGTYRRALFVASSFGDGERRTARAASAACCKPPRELKHLQYAVLALGDRNYSQFCGFGHALDQRLAFMGAPLHPIVEVDNGDAGALARWGSVARLDGRRRSPMCAERGRRRQRLHQLAPDGPHPAQPRQHRRAFVRNHAARRSRRRLASGRIGRYLAGALRQDATPRRYSLASIPQDGCMQLVVRKVNGGLASGWLTAQAAIGDEVRVRLVANPSFDASYAAGAGHLRAENATGEKAGLRAHAVRCAGITKLKWQYTPAGPAMTGGGDRAARFAQAGEI
jgi:sulfite reductase (NADPH) flavoprotein alpha-component